MRGHRFWHAFHDSLRFELSPSRYGWTVSILITSRPEEDLSRLTPPFHSVPNPREIEGWHFRNDSNTGPNDGSVNARGFVREFIFSPRVGMSIHYPPSADQVEQIRKDGSGILRITAMEFGRLHPEGRVDIARMKFHVLLLVSF